MHAVFRWTELDLQELKVTQIFVSDRVGTRYTDFAEQLSRDTGLSGMQRGRRWDPSCAMVYIHVSGSFHFGFLSQALRRLACTSAGSGLHLSFLLFLK